MMSSCDYNCMLLETVLVDVTFLIELPSLWPIPLSILLRSTTITIREFPFKAAYGRVDVDDSHSCLLLRIIEAALPMISCRDDRKD